MGLFNSIRMGASGAEPSYTIDRSLRFNDGDSPYFDLTPSAAGSNQMTFSFWVKGMDTSSTKVIFSSGEVNARGHIYFSSNNLMVQPFNSSGAAGYVQTDMKFRDFSAWYHVVISLNNTTYSNMSSTINIYVNGVAATFSAINSNNPSGGNRLNDSQAKHIGQFRPTSGSFFDGYLAEFNFIDGQVLDQSYFGETDAVTGQWIPKKYEGSYGTEGFYLNFSDNSGTTATTLGKDSSGNGNNWTPNNFSVSDAMKDTPTNNFATMNPLNGYSGLSEGNLRFNTYNDSSGPRSVQASIALPKSGKWYWEARYQESGTGTVTTKYFGLSQIQMTTGYLTAPYVYYARSNIKNGTNSENITNAQDWYNGTGVPAVLAIAVDVDNNSVKFYHNNTLQGTITLPTLTSLQEYFFTWANSSGGSSSSLNDTFNFGADSTFQGQVSSGGNTDANGIGDFKYAPPSGHLALCSANLPDPTIKLPNKYFDTILYTANRTARSITGLEFQPDFVWIKDRTGTQNHALFDSVRGANIQVRSDHTGGDTTASSPNESLSSFDSNGFSLGTDMGVGDVNYNLTNHVAWNWDAGSSTVTNNDGSISSQVRANPTAGFSILTYTGTGSNATIGHGLGVTPNVIIVKRRNGTQNWGVYHSSIAPNDILQLDVSNAVYNSSGVFGNALATSSVFSVNAGSGMSNGNGDTYVAYCFSEVAGYSKFGSYTGNGSADGPFIFTGFRPAWVLAKRADSTGYWRLLDNKRDPHNVAHHALFPNTNDSVSDGDGSDQYNTDFLSNGFKLRTTLASSNASGGTWIYLAFAESPFKYSRAR